METQASAKPREVRLGILCLWAALALGLINSITHIFRFGTQLPLAILGSTFLLTFLFSAFFIYKISQGRNWARATYLILLLFGIAYTVRGLSVEFSHDPVMAVTSVVRVIVLLYAMYLLFSYSSDAWFKGRKKLAAAR
ncbi:hypothetical protein [Rhodanobacter sp. C05]|uniref:hypothetical protein n=1 Tax=Rhodanobacter sp. C05 TaxID=1945855 RepID=UPI000986B232|nr:hypothetical protein [Rhodanobacter sp. C05]OOG39176.1 hypothetical protein B0E51_11460 [Rhodanobacter sp. C05]